MKLVVMPPCAEERWVDVLRRAVPDAQVVLCPDEETAARELRDAEGAFGTPPPGSLATAKQLRWLQAPQANPPAGWYSPEVVAHPTVVTNFRGIFNEHLTAHILAMTLAFARGLPTYFRQQQQGIWKPGAPVLHLPDAAALIVGVGGIGAETARQLSGMGVTVMATDARRSTPPPGVSELHSTDGLDELLPRADLVICTAPETPNTQGMFHRDRFRRMRNTAFFINISRGALVRLNDVTEALRAGELAGAGLDVFEQEPLPSDHPLWSLPNVILTPHVGSDGPYLDDRRAAILGENARRLACGVPLLNVVDKAAWF